MQADFIIYVVLYHLKILKNDAPTLRCIPPLVVGMPVKSANNKRSHDRPRARFHENDRPGIPVLVFGGICLLLLICVA